MAGVNGRNVIDKNEKISVKWYLLEKNHAINLRDWLVAEIAVFFLPFSVFRL